MRLVANVVRWRWLSPVYSYVGLYGNSGGSRRRIHRRFNLNRRIYYWQRERDRKDVTDGDKYKTNLSHSTWNANLDFSLVMLLICSALILPRLRRLKWRKTATALTRTKSRFQKSNKAYDEDGPAIKAV
ncbi:hypothetical protein AM328_004294 [Escherichia coli]|nr:hypothetical protein AM328_004294 [Escherichia coli]